MAAGSSGHATLTIGQVAERTRDRHLGTALLGGPRPHRLRAHDRPGAVLLEPERVTQPSRMPPGPPRAYRRVVVTGGSTGLGCSPFDQFAPSGCARGHRRPRRRAGRVCGAPHRGSVTGDRCATIPLTSPGSTPAGAPGRLSPSGWQQLRGRPTRLTTSGSRGRSRSGRALWRIGGQGGLRSRHAGAPGGSRCAGADSDHLRYAVRRAALAILPR